jgi:carbamoyl-phosphate synthase large subunit
LDEALNNGLTASPIHEVLVEKAVLGWKEYDWNCSEMAMITW